MQQIRFFGKIDSSSDVIGVTLRQSTNRNLYRTWNTTIDTTSFKQYVIPDLSACPRPIFFSWKILIKSKLNSLSNILFSFFNFVKIDLVLSVDPSSITTILDLKSSPSK